MLLIDEPYVSDFLIDTIREYRFRVIATPVARKLVRDDSLNWIEPAEAIKELQNHSSTPLYSVSENGLAWIAQHLPGSAKVRQVRAFKDKLAFRELLRDVFPDFTFKRVGIDDIQTLSLQDLSFPFVIKPSVGFFSIGVHIINDEADWVEAKRALQPEKLRSFFPESVLNTSDFIIEEYITGEEYAVDYYHDQNGQVVILNVLHHVFSSGTDTSDRVYTTSRDIITSHQEELADFLGIIGKKLQLKNFAAHAEVRIDTHGTIRPIEINPLRFGGWCTTGDLLGVTLGLNTYDHFFANKRPDWDLIFRGKEDKLFSIIVLNNSSGIDAADIASFDYDKLAAEFENPALIRKFDIKEFPVFGFVFAETSKANERELRNILTSDLRPYIVPG